MNILLTGCAGFIGSNVARLLLERGDTVVGIDDLNDAYDTRLKTWRLDRLKSQPNFTFLRADVADSRRLIETVQPVAYDAVINLAARAGVRQSVENPHVYVQTNILGTLNLLELCRARGIRKFVLASTSSVYGDGERPFKESAKADRPLSPYAATKRAAEQMSYSYHYLAGIDVTVLRYFTVYGPAGRPDMSIFRFVRWVFEGQPVEIYGDGNQERDFTFVDDIADGTVRALRPLGYATINLGSDAPVSIREVIGLVEKFTGKRAKTVHTPAHPSDVKATWADIDAAGKLLEWRPKVDISEGVRRTVEWYRENRALASSLAVPR